VYASRKKALAAAERSAALRMRENSAARLKTAIPTLKTLRIGVTEEGGANTMKHVKHIVVDRAPALLFIPCGEPRCEDGGHDITHEVMRVLYDRRTHGEGRHECGGTTGLAPCVRRILFEVDATFGD
jgi:hypothetical protein